MSDNVFDAWDDNFKQEEAPAQQEQPQGEQETPETPQSQQEPPAEQPAAQESVNESEQPAEQPEAQADDSEPTYSDENVLSYLNKQLGTEYKTLTELKREENTNDDLNPIAKTFNEYAKETGRSLNDWIRLQNLSSQISDAKDEDIVRLQYEYDNPHLDPKEAAELFESDFQKLEIDEDVMDEDEIAKAQKHNRLVDIKLKSASVKAKESLNSQVEKYKAPSEQKQESSFDAEGFTESYNNYLQNDIEELEFDLGDGQTFSVKVDDNLKQTSISTPEQFLESFVDEQGQWDLEKWSTAMMAVQHIDKILKIAVNQKSSEAKEEIIKKDLKNTSIDTHKRDNNATSASKSPYKTMADALWS
jgi:hypothetical protein